jgi:hypothetical protein
MTFKSVIYVALFLVVLSTPVLAQVTDETHKKPVKISTPIEYQNTEYGFCMKLPADWKGYSITNDSWSGKFVETQEATNGPEVTLVNPASKPDDPYQNIPIMIFTKVQWERVEKEDIAVSAAPIGPSLIGHNDKYYFALPPRWIGFTDVKGWKEVEDLMYNSGSFEASCQQKNSKWPLLHKNK